MYSFQLGNDEKILKKDHASLSVDGEAYTGALYLTNEKVVFVGYILDIKKKFIEEIPFQLIRTITKEKTFFLLSNVLVLETIRDRSLRFVVNNRQEWFDAIGKQMDE